MWLSRVGEVDAKENYLLENAHKPIIELEKFDKVQEELRRSSNVEFIEGKVKRKVTRYSIKKENKI